MVSDPKCLPSIGLTRYTETLKAVQKADGRLDLDGCAGGGTSTLLSLLPIAVVGLGLCGLVSAGASVVQLCDSFRGGSDRSHATTASVQC